MGFPKKVRKSLNEVEFIFARLDEVVASHPGGSIMTLESKARAFRVASKNGWRSLGPFSKIRNISFWMRPRPTWIAKTEDEIDEGLAELMKGRTVVMVAHHYAPVKKADYVVVMEQGKVVDQGHPEELLKAEFLLPDSRSRRLTERSLSQNRPDRCFKIGFQFFGRLFHAIT
jgi:hypothetical protein